MSSHQTESEASGPRPLPTPYDPTITTNAVMRRSLPRPPAISNVEPLPPSRSGRALPPVPVTSATPPRQYDGDSANGAAIGNVKVSYTSTTLETFPQRIDRSQEPRSSLLVAQRSPGQDVVANRQGPLFDGETRSRHMSVNSPSPQVWAYERGDRGIDTESESGYPARDGRGTPTQSSWLQARREDPRTHMQESGIAYVPDHQFTYSYNDENSRGVRDKLSHVASASSTPWDHTTSSSRETPSEGLGTGWSDLVLFPDARPHRTTSTRSSLRPSIASASRPSTELSPSWAEQPQAPSAWVERKLQIHQSHRADMYDDESMLVPESQYDEEEDWDEEEEVEVDESRFFNRALLSEMALQVKDKVNKSRHTKAGIAWVGSFTGKDIVVSTIPSFGPCGSADLAQTSIQALLPAYTREATGDRRYALFSAHSLQNQLWFVEVDWDIKPLRDSAEDVFRFMGEMEGMGDALTGELPKGVLTMATRCYSPSCTEDRRCYSPRCPYRTNPDTFLGRRIPAPTPTTTRSSGGRWLDNVDPLVLHELSESQKRRQTVIHQAIQSETQYEGDLAAIERYYIEGLRNAAPQVITPAHRREEFIQQVFSNTHVIREATRRLIENFAIRQREQPIILTVGDIFLEAAADFHDIYPEYTGNLPHAELVLSQELAENPELRLFVEVSFN